MTEAPHVSEPRDLLRTREEIYKTLKLAERDLSDAEIIDLMVEHPDLIQRPIVEKGAKAILARAPGQAQLSGLAHECAGSARDGVPRPVSG